MWLGIGGGGGGGRGGEGGGGVLRLLLDTLPTVVTAFVMLKGGCCKLEITAGAVC